MASEHSLRHWGCHVHPTQRLGPIIGNLVICPQGARHDDHETDNPG